MSIHHRSGIHKLEERLTCLHEKYEELTQALERERSETLSDDTGNIPEILLERRLIVKQMDMLKKRIQSQSKHYVLDNIHISPGCWVELKNHTHNLQFHLVSENNGQPEIGHISVSSPVGQAVVGRKLGEEISVELPRGKTEYLIAAIK